MNPISHMETSVSYFGVRLEKAQDASGDWVPPKARFTDYINTPLALDLQRRLAISFNLGHPILIEGDTGIGKTTTVKKMAADLGWEVYAVPCPGSSPEHLMGHDGPVTRGLRQEEGTTKVILLEDLNFQWENRPRVHAVLAEVLDALERNGTVEGISVSRDKTKVVALVCPPGPPYLNREPLEPGFLRRWVYQKIPRELSENDAELDAFVRGLFLGGTGRE